MEKLLYHLVSGQTHTWSETEFRVNDALKIAKKSNHPWFPGPSKVHRRERLEDFEYFCQSVC